MCVFVCPLLCLSCFLSVSSRSVCLCFSLCIALFWRSRLTLDLLRYPKCIQSPLRLVMLSHSSASLQGRNPSSDSTEDGFLKEDPLQFTVRQHSVATKTRPFWCEKLNREKCQLINSFSKMAFNSHWTLLSFLFIFLSNITKGLRYENVPFCTNI